MTVNKWVPEVSTFDSMLADFEGWISIKGLPFNSWTCHTIQSIGVSCGGLEDIHPSTKDFCNLFEAIIKVKATRAVEVPQIVYQLIEDNGSLSSSSPTSQFESDTENCEPKLSSLLSFSPQRLLPHPTRLTIKKSVAITTLIRSQVSLPFGTLVVISGR